MVVTGRQLQWLLDSDAVDQRTRDRIAKSYGDELTAPDKLDQLILMLWEDRYAIPQLLADKQCPHKSPPPHAMTFPLPHPDILEEMPEPAQDHGKGALARRLWRLANREFQILLGPRSPPARVAANQQPLDQHGKSLSCATFYPAQRGRE